MVQILRRLTGLGQISLDFLLIPLGIIFFEISVLISDVVRGTRNVHGHDYLAHLIHFILLFIFIYGVRKILALLKITSLRILQLILLGILIAVFSEVVFNLVFDALNTGHQRGIALSLRTILFLGVFWFPIAVFSSSHFRTIPTFIQEFEHTLLINARIELRKSKKNIEAEREIEENILARLRKKTSLLADQISAVAIELNEGNVKQIQELLKTNSLRSLSAELESRGNQSKKISKASQSLRVVNIFTRQLYVFIRASLRLEKIPTSVIALLMMFGVAPSLLNTLPPSRSILAILVLILITILLCNIPEIISRKNNLPSATSRLVSYLFLCYLPLITNVVSQWIFPYPGGHTPFFITAVNFPVLFAIELAITQALVPIFKNSVPQIAYVPSPAILRLKLVKIHEELEARISHQWAVFIHGNMLTRFATTSLRMQQALENNDSEAFNKLRISLVDLLENPTIGFNFEALKLSDELSSRIDPWFGILDVDLKLQDGLGDLRSERVQDIGDVIEEILSNSVRHGGATEIRIEISKSDANTIKINAIDNPTKSPNLKGRNPGLGTKIFNLVSDGRWEIEYNQNETIFTIYISVDG